MFLRLVFVILLGLAAPLLAQQGFYLRPGVEQKITVNKGRPIELVTRQGNTITTMPLHYFGSGAYNIGMAVGYRTSRSYFEVAEWQDEAEVGGRDGYNNTFSDTNVFIIPNQYYHGSSYGRTSIQYGRCLFENRVYRNGRKARWELWGYGAMELFHRPRIPAKSTFGDAWHFNTVDSAAMLIELETPYRVSPFVRLGLMVKAFKNNGHSIINIGISYMQAVTNRDMAISKHTVKNYSDGLRYIYSIRSRGSGIYFQVSKDIYFNRIFHRKRRTIDPFLETPNP